jgi:hypothetical protein
MTIRELEAGRKRKKGRRGKRERTGAVSPLERLILRRKYKWNVGH